jgi:uncharacterized protein YjbI with pentapeptide repeats
VANDEHLALLRQGPGIWNKWLGQKPGFTPDLSQADLTAKNLMGVNFTGVNLSSANLAGADLTNANLVEADLTAAKLYGADLIEANLTHAKLREANLSGPEFKGANLTAANLSGADLSCANLRGTNLNRANLSGANLDHADLSGPRFQAAYLTEANLRHANLSYANLSRANLSGANLAGADLKGADLTEAYLLEANLHEANLKQANLTRTQLCRTILGDLDLGDTGGLESCTHIGPSSIDFLTLSRSGILPVSFLRGCGLPDGMIEYLPSVRRDAIQFYSCFISYSAKDQMFAERLHADLQNKGVRCWFAPHDLPTGAKTWDYIDAAIRLRDKLLLILSKRSIASEWVEDEVGRAFAKERERKEVVLFPIRIDNTVISTDEPWAVKLRDQRNIGDFRQWRRPAEYQKSLERLLRDLKASGAK